MVDRCIQENDIVANGLGTLKRSSLGMSVLGTHACVTPATLGATPMRDPQKLEELKYRMLIAVADQTIFYDFTAMRRVQKWMPGREP